LSETFCYIMAVWKPISYLQRFLIL
jgi:hypothetical protein